MSDWQRQDWIDLMLDECETWAVIGLRDPRRTAYSIAELLQRHGKNWTHAMSINDLTFDFMAPALAAAGLKGEGPPVNISAGDGSEVAFQRIREGEYQAGTVAEPLRLQGWQIVDEANRALNKQKDSGYVAPAHLFIPANIKFDGGPKNTYDPDNGYTDAYLKIWGVK